MEAGGGHGDRPRVIRDDIHHCKWLPALEVAHLSHLADIKLPLMIQKPLERYRRGLPELMKQHADEWKRTAAKSGGSRPVAAA